MKPGRHKIKISKSLQTRIRKGHPWVHFYEIKKDIENAQPGDLGVVYDASNRFLALGLYDPYSDIRLRVLQTGQPVTVDEDFFRNRLVKALALRQELESEGTTGYRVINGENDGFPGLVMDRYDNTLVIKLYTSAWFPYMEELAEVIQDCLPQERAVVLLSRHVSRLPDARVWHEKMLFGSMVDAPVLFSENGLLFEADILKGQKTGFFFDQRENRQRIQELSKDRNVLNAFSYTGGFSVFAISGGAQSVHELEINPEALAVSQKNVLLNFPEWVESPDRFIQTAGDGFKMIKQWNREGKKFDLVILDPPAFANQKKHKKNALQAYLTLAREAAGCVVKGGTLFSASCSSKVGSDEFYRAVDLGVRHAGRRGKKVFKSGHAKDHPVSFREGAYLKAICLDLD